MPTRRFPCPTTARHQRAASEVRIQFTEAIEMAFSSVTVTGPNKEVVSQGKLRKLADDTSPSA